MHRRPRATRFGTIAVAAVAIAGLATGPAAASPPEQGTCPHTIVFGVDGTLKVGKPTSTVHPILEGLAERGARTVRIDYPGEISPLGSHTYDRSKEIGVRELHRQITLAHAECPGAAYRVVGFSQGAAIAGDVLADLLAGGHQRQVGVVAGRGRVVVARGQVAVAPQFFFLAAHDQHRNDKGVEKIPADSGPRAA